MLSGNHRIWEFVWVNLMMIAELYWRLCNGGVVDLQVSVVCRMNVPFLPCWIKLKFMQYLYMLLMTEVNDLTVQ